MSLTGSPVDDLVNMTLQWRNDAALQQCLSVGLVYSFPRTAASVKRAHCWCALFNRCNFSGVGSCAASAVTEAHALVESKTSCFHVL